MIPSARPWILGVTGGIGTGKSSVCRLLRGLRGWPCLEADRFGQEALTFGTEPVRRLAQRFGPGILRPDGGVDTDRLADRVFSDGPALAALNEITHPWILERCAAEASALWESGTTDIILLDAALLIDWLDRWPTEWTLRIAAVTAPLPLRLARLAERGMPPEEALRRVRRQRGDEELCHHALWVVENSGSWAALVRSSVALAQAVAEARAGS